jgi:poly(beta-D-mannuronate) lyase
MHRVASSSLKIAAPLLAIALAASGQALLRSPWDGHPIAATDAPYTCPPIVHLSPNLTTNGFYGDSKSSVIDTAKMAAYAASSGPYKKLGQTIVDAADAWRSTGSRSAAACVVSHAVNAARDGVFTGRMSSRQAYYVQGWVIGAIAIAWLKVRDSGLETPGVDKLVLPWIVSVVHQSMDFYGREHARNNHLYWAGVEAAAAAVAANDRSLFRWAMNTCKVGIKQIHPDGSMPLEMARGQRALHYHLFALSPLVYLAEFGEDNGLHLYAERDHALARLERRSVDGLYDNSFFVKATGIPQDLPAAGPPAAEQVSWGVIWQSRFPDPKLAALLARASSLSYMYLGGLPPGIHRLPGLPKEQP